MNTVDQWQVLNDKDKVGHLLEQVMGCFILEETAQGYHTPAFPRGVHAPDGFHWPIAFWNTDGECWAYKDIADNGVTLFDPLHSLDDAWFIVRRMNQPPAYDYYGAFIEHFTKIVGSDLFFDLFYCDKDGDHLTPERLCQAAYLAVDEELK